MRIFPEMCAKTLCPFSSSTRNMAFGNDSRIVPSNTIASSFGLGRVVLLELWVVTALTSPDVHRHAGAGEGPRSNASARASQRQAEHQVLADLLHPACADGTTTLTLPPRIPPRHPPAPFPR